MFGGMKASAGERELHSGISKLMVCQTHDLQLGGLHENDAGITRTTKTTKTTQTPTDQRVESWICGNHGNDENDENPGHKPEVLRRTGLEILDS